MADEEQKGKQRLNKGHVAAVIATAAVFVALLGIEDVRGNRTPKDSTGKQEVALTLPSLSTKEIKFAEVKVLSPQEQVAPLQTQYLEKIVTVYNTEPKQVRPRYTGTTPDFTIEMLLTSGKTLWLGIAKGQPIMAAYNGATFWIDSRGLTDVLRGADTLVRRPDAPMGVSGRLFDPELLNNMTAVQVRRTDGGILIGQKTTTDPVLIARVTGALAKAAFVTSGQNAPEQKGDPLSISLRPSSGYPTLLYFYGSASAPVVRNQDYAGWWSAPELEEALAPLMPPHYLTSEQVVEIARTYDATVQWWPRYEEKGSFAIDGDLIWVAVGLNSRDERVALYIDPVSGRILRSDPPEGMEKAVAAVEQFYALISHGDYRSVWELLHTKARHPNPNMTPAVVQARLDAKQGKPGPALISATAGKMSLDYVKYPMCMCMIRDSVYVTAKLSDGTEQRMMVSRERDGVWRILWTPEG